MHGLSHYTQARVSTTNMNNSSLSNKHLIDHWTKHLQTGVRYSTGQFSSVDKEIISKKKKKTRHVNFRNHTMVCPSGFLSQTILFTIFLASFQHFSRRPLFSFSMYTIFTELSNLTDLDFLVEFTKGTLLTVLSNSFSIKIISPHSNPYVSCQVLFISLSTSGFILGPWERLSRFFLRIFSSLFLHISEFSFSSTGSTGSVTGLDLLTCVT